MYKKGASKKKETSNEISEKKNERKQEKIGTSKEVKVRREHRHCLRQRVLNE
jgi:hypothetical protein